jgi:acetyltransferase
MWKGKSTAAPVTVRHAVPADLPLIVDLLERLSDQTRYLRYCHPVPRSPAWAWAEAARMLRQGGSRVLTLVAVSRAERTAEVIGVGELVIDGGAGASAELALLVRDDQQGRGVGTELGRRLVGLARARGLAELYGHLLPENRASLALLRRLGAPYTTAFDGELLHAVLNLAAPVEASSPRQPAHPRRTAALGDRRATRVARYSGGRNA